MLTGKIELSWVTLYIMLPNRVKISSSYWNTTELPKARENGGDQVVIGFSFASDWMKKWRRSPEPITQRSKAKLKQSPDYFQYSIARITRNGNDELQNLKLIRDLDPTTLITSNLLFRLCLRLVWHPRKSINTLEKLILYESGHLRYLEEVTTTSL